MSPRAAAPEIGTAQAEASAAQSAVSETEAALASGERVVSADRLHKVRDKARHAVLDLQGKQARAEREAAEARSASLAELGAEHTKLAAQAPPRLEARLQALAAAAAAVREEIALHNGQVADLAAAAQDLRVEPPAPLGPRESSGFIALAGGTVRYRDTVLAPVSDPVTVVSLAVSGDVAGALAEAMPVREAMPGRRARYYFRSRSGVLVTAEDISACQRQQLQAGTLVPLSEREIAAYLRGDAA